ncbi:MAG TPA: TetR/AcrR family transcriptional regulator [Solirubrobacterales bacterium]
MEPRRQNRRDMILKEALQLFSERGFRETSLQDIADRLGVTRPAFYYYFSSKEEILWSLIEQLGYQLLDQARPLAARPEPPATRLAALLAEHTRTLLRNAEAFRVYFAERDTLDDTRSESLRKGEHSYAKLVAAVIEEGQRAGQIRTGNPTVLALLALGTANSVLRWYRADGPLEPEELAALVPELALAGLQPRTS